MNAIICDTVWQQPIKIESGGIKALPVFRWWFVNRAPGTREFNVLAFLYAVTEDLETVSMRGIVSFGAEGGKPFIQLWTGGATHRLWLIGRPRCWQD